MSGHSKFANIKHKKEKNDAAKGKIFTVIGRELAVAVKAGGSDPANNSRLRDAIAKAKSNNMPNDTIERSIKKAAGDLDSVNYESITYEGYGPNGVAVIVETLTDNRNRSAANVRSAFTKGGGNMGNSGCVSFMFDEKGQIMIAKDDDKDIDAEELEMTAIEAGAEDITESDEGFEIITTPEDFSAVREALEAAGFTPDEAEVTMIPQTYTSLTDEDDNCVSLTLQRAKEPARTPQTDNLRNQLGKLGNTPFEVKDIKIDLSDNWFIPSSELSELRRNAVDKLLEVRRINYRREVFRMKETKSKFPVSTLTYLGNVMNSSAAEFYKNHGVLKVMPAFEKEQPKDAVLMFCKHCIRYSMGWCPVHHKVRSPFREPYYLVSSDGRRFRLEFDCKQCQMKVLADNPAQ